MNTTESHLLDGVRAFCFPGGEEAARRIRAVQITERGEMQTAPNARRIEFTSTLEIDARQSRFRWQAQFRGGLRLFSVTDAYEDGRGYLAIRAGVLPLRKMTGPEFDRGELQRYLASFALCPPMLLNHRTLSWMPVAPNAVRVAEAGVSIDLECDERGRPVGFSGDRPRMLGNRAVLTAWRGSADDFRDWDGIRVAGRTEAYWQLPEGEFRYYRSEITSVMARA